MFTTTWHVLIVGWNCVILFMCKWTSY